VTATIVSILNRTAAQYIDYGHIWQSCRCRK
jgi:hypothetical protein